MRDETYRADAVVARQQRLVAVVVVVVAAVSVVVVVWQTGDKHVRSSGTGQRLFVLRDYIQRPATAMSYHTTRKRKTQKLSALSLFRL